MDADPQVEAEATPIRTETRLQIVGVDGSESSMHALRWAVRRTDLLGDVEPLATWRYPWWALVPTATGTLAPPSTTEFQAIAGRVADRMIERLDSDHIRDAVLVHGAAGPALVAAGDRASLIVVGSRGRNKVASGVLGSVSAHCVHHATVPVAVIPTIAHVRDRFQRIVVGVDGSKHGIAALEWAMENTPASSKIDAINVWNSDAVNAESAALATAYFQEESEELIVSTIDGVRERAERSGRLVRGRSERGDPRARLRSEAEKADLLVIGARGGGRLEHLLLGSVATSLVHQPQTPTVVVR